MDAITGVIGRWREAISSIVLHLDLRVKALALVCGFIACSVLIVAWWNPFGPRDWEDCAEQAAKQAPSNGGLAVLIDLCNSRFLGRRRSQDGGYIYEYDAIDWVIAGPNPTRKELDLIYARAREKNVSC